MKEPVGAGKADFWAAIPGQLLPFSLLFSLISISLGEGFLFLAVAVWAIWMIKDKQKFTAPMFVIPLAAYAVLSLVSSAFSVNPTVSFLDCRELALYLIIPVAYMSLRSLRNVRKANLAVFASAAVSIAYSFYLFAVKRSPEARISGFMGHYMTQAGLLVLFASAALAIFVFERRKIRFLWGAGAAAAMAALGMTMTRSAWIGLAAAVCVIVILRDWRFIVAVPVAFVLIFALSPAPVKQRALSIFKLRDFSNRMRMEYVQAGIKIIGDYPLTGCGPDTADMVFQNPKYGLSDDARRNVHLHNDLIQIAAERGIPALLAWLAFIAWAVFDLVRLARIRDPEILPLAAGALAAVTALFVSGFFEYNFGDSEVVILFMYLVAMPFAAARAVRTPAPGGR